MKSKLSSRFVVVSLVASACLVGAVAAGAQEETTTSQPRPTGSLFNAKSRSIYADYRAVREGDILTIVVNENTQANSQANTKATRSDAMSFTGLTSGYDFFNKLFRPFNLSGNNSINGQGQTNRTGNLVTRISVVVKKVEPNGNLLIEGKRDMLINAEKQTIVFSGLVRPVDVLPDNTVASTAVANAQINYTGKGPVGDRQRKGLLSTVLGWLF